jgi:HK97 family phage prohead protease
MGGTSAPRIREDVARRARNVRRLQETNLLVLYAPHASRRAVSPGMRRTAAATDEYYNSSEQFMAGCFATSIERGGQYVTVDHGLTVPGRLQLFETPSDLRFRFFIHDSALGRSVLEHTRRGDLRGASIGFRSQRSRYERRSVLVHDVADLAEIALCLNRRPAWYSTVVQEEL